MYFAYGERELEHLRAADARIAAVIDKLGVLRREMNPDFFAALVESIIGQQISSKAAQTVRARLHAASGMNAENIYALGIEDIRACGMSMRKASYIKNIAEAAVIGLVNFSELHKWSDEKVIKTLTQLKGVGVWTAEMLLIFSLGRPDVLSYGDLAIRRGIMRLYNLEKLSKTEFLRITKPYSPYSSVASFYLWEVSAQ